MKRTALLFAVLLAVPALAAAQTQTREQSPDDSTTVRQRIVGAPRAANHAEKPTLEKKSNSTGPSNQNGNAPKWGNTAVVPRSGPSARVALLQNSASDKPTNSQDKAPVKKLVQQTSMVSGPQRTLPIVSASAAPRTVAARALAPTLAYNVGIGDVLDIRLSNLPTRESTLYTVLKNGLLEYPLLDGPLSVTGMTTDEIARLLSNEIKVIKSARVSVSVRDYASHSIVITGLVDSPGKKTMRREAMPLFAVVAEALPRPEASLINIVRNGSSQTILRTDELAMSTLVVPGDVIKVSGGNSTATRFVYVGGDVSSRGEKEFRDGMTLTQAILSAGGVNRSTKTSVRVARRDSGGFLKSSEYNLRMIEEGKSQDPLLQAGDRIEVTQGM